MYSIIYRYCYNVQYRYNVNIELSHTVPKGGHSVIASKMGCSEQIEKHCLPKQFLGVGSCILEVTMSQDIGGASHLVLHGEDQMLQNKCPHFVSGATILARLQSLNFGRLTYPWQDCSLDEPLTNLIDAELA